eukprot:Skav208427  [mRNA]  locus=scaffold2953:479842:493356:+ [translate_table: standard]
MLSGLVCPVQGSVWRGGTAFGLRHRALPVHPHAAWWHVWAHAARPAQLGGPGDVEAQGGYEGDLTLEEADALFIAAAMPPKDTSGHLQAYRTEGRMIHRHGFFGLLVRLAIRFARGNAARGLKGRFNDNREQVKKALQYIFAKHLMYPYAPMKNNLRCVQWRESVLHTQAVVDPLFCSFAAGRFLTPEELMSVARPVEAEHDWLVCPRAPQVFPCSDESLNTDTLQMNAWDRAPEPSGPRFEIMH